MIDDSAQTLAEYALIMATLTIGGYLAAEFLGLSANASESMNQTNVTNRGLTPP